MVLHADRVRANAETYIGLVEVGVGIIPAGCGTKEMLVRALDSIPKDMKDADPFSVRQAGVRDNCAGQGRHLG